VYQSRRWRLEYIALSTTPNQQLWLQSALNELHIDSLAAALNADNNGSIDLTRISDRSKHIDIADQHERDLVETGKINLLHVPSKNDLADVNTKPLPRPQFLYLREQVSPRPSARKTGLIISTLLPIFT